jgi:hypothetical protein
MDAEVVTLINSGATTLLGLMVTDAWGRAKRGAVALFGGSDKGDPLPIASDLEESCVRLRAALDAGDVEAQTELATEWRSRLRRAVQNGDLALNSLREFVDENSGVLEKYNVRVGEMSIHAEARDNSRVYQQGSGTQYNY